MVRVNREPEIGKYSEAYVQELMKDGLSRSEAVRVASTVMAGVQHRPDDGGVNGTQTGCLKLHYRETGKDTRTWAGEGGDATRAALSAEFGVRVNTDRDADRLANDWLRKEKERLRKGGKPRTSKLTVKVK